MHTSGATSVGGETYAVTQGGTPGDEYMGIPTAADLNEGFHLEESHNSRKEQKVYSKKQLLDLRLNFVQCPRDFTDILLRSNPIFAIGDGLWFLDEEGESILEDTSVGKDEFTPGDVSNSSFMKRPIAKKVGSKKNVNVKGNPQEEGQTEKAQQNGRGYNYQRAKSHPVVSSTYPQHHHINDGPAVANLNQTPAVNNSQRSASLASSASHQNNALIQQRGSDIPSSREHSYNPASQTATPAPRKVGEWRTAICPKTKKTYYWHTKTREVTWKAPADYVPPRTDV